MSLLFQRAFALAIFLFVFVLPARAAFTTQSIDVTSTEATSRTNWQVLMELTPANFNYANALADGSDIRFGTGFAAGALATVYEHFFESWNSGGTSLVWVRLPSLPGNGTVQVTLVTGSTQPGGSDFAATFPSAFVAPAGSTALTGANTYDWFEVPVGATITVTPGTPLEITARRIIVAGTIDGIGAGYAGVTTASNGNGPGAGTAPNPNNAGAGGGSHGGVGGTGGLDAGDTPGVGGPVYGSAVTRATGADRMGSSGGNSDQCTDPGSGPGGGGVILVAEYVSAVGTINVNSIDRGPSCTVGAAARGAGGGAGGLIEFVGERINVSGATLSARGGSGNAGTSTANDSGGGGGGGRINYFADQLIGTPVTEDVAGGAGGPYGTAAPGQPGTVGVVGGTSAGNYDAPTFSFGTANAVTYVVSTTVSPAGAGSVSCVPNPVPHGSSTTCTATAAVGYTFANFSGDCVGATCTINNVTMNRSVTANFTANTYTVTTTASPLAGGSVSCLPANPVPHGANVTCTATAAVGYTFANFSGDCAGATCTINNVTMSRSVTANFTANTYTVTTTASPLAGGSVSCLPANPVPQGSNVTCTALAAPGYVFSGFSGACSGMTCVLSAVNANQTVSATFAAAAPQQVPTWPWPALLALIALIGHLGARSIGRSRA